MLLEGLLVLGLTVLVLALLHRFRLPAVLGYLTAGIVLRELGYDLYGQSEQLELLGELGLVFLLFTLGLEFSLPHLKSLRQAVFETGPAQLFGTTALLILPLLFSPLGMSSSFVIAVALAMSSTALVSGVLSQQRELNTRHGRTAIGVLIFQDIAAVPLLILIPALAASGDTLWQSMGFAFAKGITAALLLILIGRKVLPPMFHWLTRTPSDELFVLACLLVALVAAAVTHALGLSMALGAFLAGALLGESQYRHQVEAEIRPFRDVLLGLFFIGIGNLLTLGTVAGHLHVILLAVPALIVVKFAVVAGFLRLRRERRREALITGMVLAQAGEFGFALLALAADNRLLSREVVSVALAIGIISMLISPFILRHTGTIADRLLGRQARADEDGNPVQIIESTAHDLSDHVIVCGFGRVGQLIVRFTAREGMQTLALDRDAQRVQEATQAGIRLCYGDATRNEILRAAGIDRARMVVVCVDRVDLAQLIVQRARQLRPDVSILVRTQDDTHLDTFRQAGATEIVPEVLEGSLMLVSHVLVLLGVPMSRVLHRVQQARRDRYRQLQGFFLGGNADLSLERNRRVRMLHAVTITQTAAARGHKLGEFPFRDWAVDVRSVHRGGEEHDARDDWPIRAGDSIVLMGLPEDVEAAEAALLSGAGLAHHGHS